jgi:hypothetical protein
MTSNIGIDLCMDFEQKRNLRNTKSIEIYMYIWVRPKLWEVD